MPLKFFYLSALITQIKLKNEMEIIKKKKSEMVKNWAMHAMPINARNVMHKCERDCIMYCLYLAQQKTSQIKFHFLLSMTVTEDCARMKQALYDFD